MGTWCKIVNNKDKAKWIIVRAKRNFTTFILQDSLLILFSLPIFDETLLMAIAQTINVKNSITAR